MLTLRDIMSKNVVTIRPDATLREVAEVFSDEHIGGAPVVNGGELMGVISTTDLIEFQYTQPGAPVQREEMAGRFEPPDTDEWMEREESPPPEAWAERDESQATYFTDYWDDTGADLVQRFGRPDSPEWNVMDEHTASEIVTRDVVSLPPDSDVREAAETMSKNRLHRVLVLEDGRLAGVVTTTDVVRAVAEYGLGDG